MNWSNFCLIVCNGLIRFGVIWMSVNWFLFFVIPNNRIFAPNFFNLNIIFALSIFEKNYISSKVFTFTFFCAIPRQAPLGKIWRPYDKVEYVIDPLPGPGNLWVWYSNGSWWVNSNTVILVLPKINTHFVIIFPTPKGEFPITFSLYINESTWLVLMHDELVDQPRITYCNIFRPYSYFRQLDTFNPIAVGVFQLIHSSICIFAERYFSQTELTMMVLVYCWGNLWNEEYIYSYFLQFHFFDRVLFNFVSRFFFQ